jgi:hypothetical protein
MGYLLILMFLMTSVFGFELRVSGMALEQEMNQSFKLKTNHANPVTLDCQSFLQGLYLGPRNTTDIILLDAWECEELYHRIEGSLEVESGHCLDVEEVIHTDYSC